MGGDQLAAVPHLQEAVASHHLDRLADQRERHRVAVRVNGDEVVGRHHPRQRRLEPKRPARWRRNQRVTLASEPVNRPLVRRPVHAHVGHRRHPLLQLLVEVEVVAESPARQEISLEILHTRLDFPLRLGPVGSAQPRLEAPEVGECLERRVPPHAAAPTRRADRPRPVVEMLLGATAEVRERLLVRVEQFAQRLAQTRHVEAPSREAERQHEDVTHLTPRTQPDPRLAPIDLALQSWRRLEPRTRHRRVQLRLPQRPHEPLHRLVAAPVLPTSELLEQHLGRVADLGRSSPQVLRVRGQQRVNPRRPLVRLPLRLPQTPAHGLAVQIQRTSNRPNRRTLARPTTNLLPPVLSDHLDLPEHLTLGVDRRRCRRHLLLPSVIEVRSFQ